MSRRQGRDQMVRRVNAKWPSALAGATRAAFGARIAPERTGGDANEASAPNRTRSEEDQP